MAYQSFKDQPGSSKSSEKFAKLRLPASLRGKRVLDLGCNQGFFCFEAKRRGAARVVGIDVSRKWIVAARERAAAENLDIEFEVGDFQDAKGEFDYILFLSAIHYARHPKAVLRHAYNLLAPNGVLVLECGLIDGFAHRMGRALRAIDERYFPSMELLRDDWLDIFAVRSVGQSIPQPGDPVPRRVFHCYPRKPTVVFVGGKGNIGKSTISRQFKNPLVISTDSLLNPTRNEPRAFLSVEQQVIDKALKQHDRHIGAAWEAVRDDETVVRYIADVVGSIMTLNETRDLIVVEGVAAGDLAPIVVSKFKGNFLFWMLDAAEPDTSPVAVRADGNSSEQKSDIVQVRDKAVPPKRRAVAAAVQPEKPGLLANLRARFRF
ncbi:class I SAM-dependent methyltransferase [Hyphomicrobium sp.]|uniref:class I SAM-dependent methyltransferase n=1 Tax=Hyphomicrobium sp. TaxID=82 RepID=UPI002B9D7EE6|nr:methyltransferase domain-containing protein [Hyphomicrobium sp.]HVZ03097.1 methyltransferase domain-containing protein [Hyphomicrobium sp.]